MDVPVLLVTYPRLTVTELEARSIIGDVYKGVHAVVDAVEALSGGRGMEPGIIYHFNGMGVSAMIPPPQTSPEEDTSPIRGKSFRDNPAVTTAAVSQDQLLMLAAHSNVSSVCKSNEIINAARLDAEMALIEAITLPVWNLIAIRADGTTARKYSGEGIKIGILDTGIAEHEHLDVKGGVSFCEGEHDFRNDSFGHGTCCAGIAAGKKRGVARGATLYSIKVASNTAAQPVPILAGLGWALRNRMNVVSISLAGRADLKHIPAFANAVQALMRINCVVVASTGDRDGNVALPANTPGIIAVGGCDRKRVILDDTNIGGKGNPMTVVAPAAEITTTSRIKNDYVQRFDGSSAAAPHVAGLVALIQEKFPGITPLQVIGRIMASAQPVQIKRDGANVLYGEKLIDCDAALALF